MAERDAAVVEIMIAPDGRALARLEFEVNGGCGRCAEPGGCGGVSLAQPLCAKPKTMVLPDSLGLAVGQKVRVAIPDHLLARGVTRTYVVSLALFFTGSFLGASLLPDLVPQQWQITHDLGAMIGAGVGLIAAWAQLKWSQHQSPMAVPRILERL